MQPMSCLRSGMNRSALTWLLVLALELSKSNYSESTSSSLSMSTSFMASTRLVRKPPERDCCSVCRSSELALGGLRHVWSKLHGSWTMFGEGFSIESASCEIVAWLVSLSEWWQMRSLSVFLSNPELPESIPNSLIGLSCAGKVALISPSLPTSIGLTAAILKSMSMAAPEDVSSALSGFLRPLLRFEIRPLLALEFGDAFS